MKKLSNGFGLVGILVLLALAISAAVFTVNKYVKKDEVSPTPNSAIDQARQAANLLEQRNQGMMEDGVEADPTADWKTYTNTKYGFEFRYPSGFTVSESLFHPYSDCKNPAQDQCGLSIKIENNLTPGKPGFGLLVNAQPDGGLYTDESYIDYKLARTSRNYLFVTGQNVISGGVIRANGSVGGSPEFDHLQLMKAGITVNNDHYIWFGKFERGGTDHSLLFKEILSTFRFTK